MGQTQQQQAQNAGKLCLNDIKKRIFDITKRIFDKLIFNKLLSEAKSVDWYHSTP